VVSTGAQTPASFGFQSPGDYATCNSNHTPDGTLRDAARLSFSREVGLSISGNYLLTGGDGKAMGRTDHRVYTRCPIERR
jgi:hypothetical protein